MATESNITEFHKGEYIEIILLAKDRDGSVISTPASQTMTFAIGDTPSGSPSLEFTTTAGDITLADVGTGEFTLQLTPTDLISLVENKTYYYNYWSEISSDQPLLQAKGQFKLLNSIEAT